MAAVNFNPLKPDLKQKFIHWDDSYIIIWYQPALIWNE